MAIIMGALSSSSSTTLTGDVLGSGAGTINTTLSNTGVVPGEYGSSSAIPVIKVDSKGRILSVSTRVISSSGVGSPIGTIDISSGGTGATTAAGARINLGVQETLVSGSNIKTINGNSILGSGNITISGGASGAGIYTVYQYSKGSISASNGNWSYSIPTISIDEYIWARTGEVTPPASEPSSWNSPYRITGAAGGYTDYIFIRSETVPPTPTSSGTSMPLGWSDAPPSSGTSPLWMSKAYRNSFGTIVGAWSIPIRLDGKAGDNIKYQYGIGSATSAPTSWQDTPPSVPTGQYMWMRVGTVTPPSTTPVWGSGFRVSGERGEIGLRGSLTGYGKTYSIYLSSNSWVNDTAARVIWRMLGGTDSNRSSNPSDYLRIGDTVTLTDSSESFALTRYWSGIEWILPGTIIDGNLLVKGSISGDKIIGYSITADKLAANVLSAVQISASQITNALTDSNRFSFNFGTGKSLFGYNGAGFFTANDPAGAFALASWNYGIGSAFTAGNSNANGTAALFSAGSSGALSKWTTAAKICSEDEFSSSNRQPTAGVFMYDSNNGNVALLGRRDQAGFFHAANKALSVSICQPAFGSNPSAALSATGDVYVSGKLYLNGTELSVSGSGGSATVNGANITPNTVVASGGITTTGGNFSTNSQGGYYGGFGSFSYNGINTTLCLYGGGANQGMYTTGGIYVEQTSGFASSLGVNYDIRSLYGNVYAGGTMLTFTGAHFALLPKESNVVIGDIVLDDTVVSRGGVSEVILSVVQSNAANQKGVLGVYSGDDNSVPMSMAKKDTNVGILDKIEFDPEFSSILETHKIVTVNSLGEGQINVCGESGDIDLGDLIVSSSIPGKGMRQMKNGEVDDIVRSYTVAKSREKVTFSSPEDIKTIACIYLCG